MTSAIRFRLVLGCAALFMSAGHDSRAEPVFDGDHDDYKTPPAKVLTVCAIPASMPRSDKAPDGSPRGIDVSVAQQLGRILHRTVNFHWCANAACAWNCLPAGRCDMIVGLPADSGPRSIAAWSCPYARAQFSLVVPTGSQGIHSLAEFHGKRVGIVAGTVFLAENDHVIVRFKSREALLDGFKARSLDAAFLDGDFAAWYLRAHPPLDLRLIPDYVPRERWNMAIAVRAKDAQLLVEINRAIGQLAETGELKRIYAEYGVPFRPPLTGSNVPKAVSNTWQRVRDRRELGISFDPANLPYSGARGKHPGLDVELAYQLAQRLGVKLRIGWLDVQHDTAIGQLLTGECDLVFGEAVADNTVVEDEELAGKVLYSRPYYGTGYILVERNNGPRVHTLADLRGAKSQQLGAEAGSLADYRLRQQGYFRRLFRNQLATLKALNDGDIDFAYLWANVGWTLHATPELHVRLVADYVPEDQWNIAVAMRRGDDELKRHVDQALEALINDGTVSRIMAGYHVPQYAPFPEKTGHPRGDAIPTIRHAAIDRGIEPRVQKIRKSKRSYSSLVRIRSAGELVVALDQNNPPFSTAHPEPAGLDFEIAALLAEQLGVRLRVYWAISAHDSYPSKLASKSLCDVILGIMRDDRFAERVLYTRPYFRASYQWVVRPGDGSPRPEEPVAIESGVAMRGLGKRPVREYASTEAILEAIATGREHAGYVISTRGSWLVHERWRGKLAFLSAGEAADQIPLCAAVRRTESDLKDAIDHAWDELDRSGQLARAFDRWHIPYDSGAVKVPRKEPGS